MLLIVLRRSGSAGILCRRIRLLIRILLIVLGLAGDRIQHTADPSLRVLSAALLARQSTEQTIRQLPRIAETRQQVVQFHLCDRLNVRREVDIRKGSGHQYRQNQFAIIVGQSGVHITANLVSADLLAIALGQHRRHSHVQRLINEIHHSGRGQCSTVNQSFEVVGCRHSIADVEIAA